MTYTPARSYSAYGQGTAASPKYFAPNGAVLPQMTSGRGVTFGNIFFTRFYAPDDIPVTSLSVWVTTGAASSYINFGIYTAAAGTTTGGMTGTVLTRQAVTTGTSLTTTTNATKVTGSLSYSMTGGTTYYLAVLASVGTPSLSSFANFGHPYVYGTGAGQWISATVSTTLTSTVTIPSILTGAGGSVNTGAGIIFMVN